MSLQGCVPKFVENRLAWLRAWTFDVTCYAANSSCWSMIAARCRYPSMRRMRICPNAISPHSSVTPAASVLNDPWVLVRRRNSRLRFSSGFVVRRVLPHRFGELVESQQHQPRFLEAARHRRHQPRPPCARSCCTRPSPRCRLPPSRCGPSLVSARRGRVTGNASTDSSTCAEGSAAPSLRATPSSPLASPLWPSAMISRGGRRPRCSRSSISHFQ